MTSLGSILVVEDDPNDLELTLTALDDHHLSDEVVVAGWVRGPGLSLSPGRLRFAGER